MGTRGGKGLLNSSTNAGTGRSVPIASHLVAGLRRAGMMEGRTESRCWAIVNHLVLALHGIASSGDNSTDA